MLKNQQELMEQHYSKTYSSEYLKECFKEQNVWALVTEMDVKLNSILTNIPIEDNRPDLHEVVHFLIEHDTEKLLWKMLSAILLKRTMTAAALAGIVYYNIKLENKHRVFLAIEFLMSALDDCPLVDTQITRGEECLFKAAIALPEDITNVLSNQGYPLPMLTRPKVRSNEDIGYLTFNESIIAGGALKHHNHDVVLSSLNRANAVAYTVETRLLDLVDFKFSSEPKLKKNGLYEDMHDIANRYEDYLRLCELVPKKVDIMLENGNRFHIPHRVDNRIRRYTKGYEFNYQGDKRIKAMVQFADGEHVVPEW